jgi:Flp pilus assembly protein CpaB
MNVSGTDQLGTRLGTPRRAVGRGTPLPSGRAALGALLVVLSGLGLTYAAQRMTAEPTTRFAVATRDIPAGEVLKPEDVRVQTMRLSPEVARRAFSDDAVLVGAVTVGPLGRGELVQSSVVQRGGPELRAMSFPIESARALNGDLDPGDRIDLVASETGIDGSTETVLTSLQVISVSGNRLEPGDSSTIVITVGIADPAQQVVLAKAVSGGDVFVVRANDAGNAMNATLTAVSPQADAPVDEPAEQAAP